MIRAVFQAGNAVNQGRDDAKAAIIEPKFAAAINLVETLPPTLQAATAYAVELGIMKNIAEAYRKNLPQQFQQGKDFLEFVDSNQLMLLAEHYLSKARSHNISVNSTPAGAGVAALELVGYYLFARSWQDMNHSINFDAPGQGACMIGQRIENRICVFMTKQGRSLPRGC